MTERESIRAGIAAKREGTDGVEDVGVTIASRSLERVLDALDAADATTARYREALRSVRIGLVESHEAEGARLRSVMFIDLALADEPKAGT